MSGQNNFDVKLVADSLEVRSFSISGGRLELTLSARLDTADLAQQIAAQLMAAATVAVKPSAAATDELTETAKTAECAVPLLSPRAAGSEIRPAPSPVAPEEAQDSHLEDAEVAGGGDAVVSPYGVLPAQDATELSADDAGAVLLGLDATEVAAPVRGDGAQSMTAEGEAPEAGRAGATDTATGMAGGDAVVAEASASAGGRYGEPQPEIEWSAVLGDLPAVPQEVAGDKEAGADVADTPSEQSGEVADLPPDTAPLCGELPPEIAGTQEAQEESGAFGEPDAARGDAADAEYPVQVEELATRRLAPDDLPGPSQDGQTVEASAAGQHPQHPEYLTDETVELPERLFPPEEEDDYTRSLRDELLRTETDTLPEPDAGYEQDIGYDLDNATESEPDGGSGAPGHDPDFPDNDADYDSFIFGERPAGAGAGGDAVASAASGMAEPEIAQTPTPLAPATPPRAEYADSAYRMSSPVEPAAHGISSAPCPPPLPSQHPAQTQNMGETGTTGESRRTVDMAGSLPPLPERKTPPRIKYVCPKCHTPGQQDADRLGSVVTCANCGRAMRLTMKK